MSARGGRRRRRGHGHGEEHENDERWLLTYSDMITLLMALFMVLFSISSVNTSKFESLQRAMQDAFSGRILSGGKAIRQTGSETETKRAAEAPPIPALQPITDQLGKAKAQARKDAARLEDEEFRSLKRTIDAYAKQHNLTTNLETTVTRRGLVVRMLTDRVLFDSGSATLKASAGPVVGRVAQLLHAEGEHPIVVEGNTDNVPIASSQFPTNWELSVARAATVVRAFIRDGLEAGRLAAAGYGAQHPLTSNASAEGRSRNRRVEIVLTRLK